MRPPSAILAHRRTSLHEIYGTDCETDELLQRHRIYEQGLTMEDLESDRRNLEQVLKAHGR
jgi:hypothetical protein